MSKAVHDADSCKLIRRRSVAVMRIGAPIEMPEMSVPNFGSRSLASLQSFPCLFAIVPITGRSRVPSSKQGAKPRALLLGACSFAAIHHVSKSAIHM